MTFEELGLNDSLKRAINDLGFTTPTPIQQQVVPLLISKPTDVVALAQTGTGKTAAFGLPILNSINISDKNTQALVLAPTRELCVQITNDLKNYAKYLNGVGITAVYGGASIENQIRDIKRGTQVVVATPGRLVDLIERRAIKLQTITTVVLDEADEMLNMGFKDSLDAILEQTPSTKNTWLFSATMPREVDRIAKDYMNEPVEISAGKRNEGAANIQHLYYMVNQRERYMALKRIADFYPEIYGIVFCRTRAETQQVADALIKDGYSADALHGDLSQGQRDLVMKRFRSRNLQMLVATDVAARGIDIDSITHIINYNLPEDVENYTHRSGRTARAGRSGISIAIITPKESGKIKDIERIINKKFEKQSVPNGFDVCEKQLFHLVKKLHDVEVKDEEIEKFLPKIYEELKDLSKEELIKRFISEEFNRFYSYYKNTPDLNQGNEGSGKKTSRFFINMGELDGFNNQSLKDFLIDLVKINERMIFNIDIKKSFSFFETETQFTDSFMNLNKQDQQFNSRKISIELSNRKMSSGGSGGKSYGSSRGEGRGYGEKKSYGEKRSYGGEKKSYGGGGERRSSGSSGGERRSSGGEKKFGGSKNEGGFYKRERKSFGGSEKSSSSSSDRKSKFSKDR